jgi:hypothetical protein
MSKDFIYSIHSLKKLKCHVLYVCPFGFYSAYCRILLVEPESHLSAEMQLQLRQSQLNFFIIHILFNIQQQKYELKINCLKRQRF